LPSLKKNPEEYHHPKDEVVIPYLDEHTDLRRLNEDKARELARHADVDAIKRKCNSFREYDSLLDALRKE
jgi:hypothetical protein